MIGCRREKRLCQNAAGFGSEGFENPYFTFVFSAVQRKKSHKSKAPSERELSPKATEGECETCVFLPLSVLAKMHDQHFLKLEAIAKILKQKN
ncbi:MAG TPA: hypothetical protein DCE08_01095 [Ruminococcaceae bacterium]|nr:hypothetical protein [Oscillospiraceae bacterium]